MLASREAVYGALFNLLSTTPGFASYWRQIPPISQLSNAQLPALMMRQKSEQAIPGGYAMPNKYVVTVELCIAASTPVSSSEVIPAEILNPLIDAVEAQLEPNIVTGRLNFNDVNVSDVVISGIIEYFEAISDDTSYAYIPISMVVV